MSLGVGYLYFFYFGVFDYFILFLFLGICYFWEKCLCLEVGLRGGGMGMGMCIVEIY